MFRRGRVAATVFTAASAYIVVKNSMIGVAYNPTAPVAPLPDRVQQVSAVSTDDAAVKERRAKQPWFKDGGRNGFVNPWESFDHSVQNFANIFKAFVFDWKRNPYEKCASAKVIIDTCAQLYLGCLLLTSCQRSSRSIRRRSTTRPRIARSSRGWDTRPSSSRSTA